jgi:myo-inositol-1(or 4)-monophosphatase
VTETDLAVERHVRAAVLERFPAHAIVGEEYGASEAEAPPVTWYVDPVDGTTNFVHGLPWSSFSLAAVDDDGPAVGVVADPYRRETISALRGRGAVVGGVASHCSGAETLVGGIVLTEMVSQSLWPGFDRFAGALADTDCVLRMMGSNALTLASVGAGRVVGAALGAFGPIDCVAGTLISREAGARVFTPAGEGDPVEGEPVLVAAPGVADELFALWDTARNA